MSIFVCGKQIKEFGQLVEVLLSFIIRFAKNPTERTIDQSTDGARSVLGNKLLQSVQRFWRSVDSLVMIFRLRRADCHRAARDFGPRRSERLHS
jgi:hypothetical protein